MMANKKIQCNDVTVLPEELFGVEKMRMKAIQAVRDHIETVKAIRKDNSIDLIMGDGMETELAIAEENLLDELAGIETDDDADIKDVIRQIKKMSPSEEDSVLILEELDEDTIYDFVSEQGFISIKLNSIDQQEKLKSFLNTEIFPHYNEQDKNIIF